MITGIGIFCIVAGLVLFLLISFANGMSDAPTAPGITYWIPAICVGVGVALIVYAGSKR